MHRKQGLYNMARMCWGGWCAASHGRALVAPGQASLVSSLLYVSPPRKADHAGRGLEVLLRVLTVCEKLFGLGDEAAATPIA